MDFYYVKIAFYATLFTWFVTALGASMVFLFKKVSNKIMSLMFGFGIVPVPGSRYSICPESLQIGRQAAGAGTADEQIASVVIVQSSQCRRLLLCEAEDALVRRERIIQRGRKRQGNTVVEGTVSGDMVG